MQPTVTLCTLTCVVLRLFAIRIHNTYLQKWVQFQRTQRPTERPHNNLEHTHSYRNKDQHNAILNKAHMLQHEMIKMGHVHTQRRQLK
jgi:hypothetical protein